MPHEKTPKVFLLKCAYQTYAWGKYGSSSEVAALLHSVNSEFVPDENTTYAELWMGTHPKGPSVIEPSGESLAQWIEQHPDSLGSKVSTGSSNQLPFLFKVLSVNIALSIQVHPDKLTAEKLRKLYPSVYADDNHKPEMAIALTPFEALCGFRPKCEILSYLKDVSELQQIVGDVLILKLASSFDENSVKLAVQDCFTALMTCADSVVEQQLKSLVSRLELAKKAGDSSAMSASLGEVLLRLHMQFPGDVGCFCIYFFNLLHLKPGEAMFLNANLPHAYLAGDCLECMACSDNVVRAGLTPKFKDVTTLCSILDYRCRPANDSLFVGNSDPADQYIVVFDPPVPEFTMVRIQLPVGIKHYTMAAVDGASIVIVLNGCAEVQNDSLGGSTVDVKRGSVLFIAASESLSFTVGSVDSGLLMFRAFCIL
jgi:mannose-6-phosphate isomerase